MPWDPAQYAKFAGPRLRPAIDLLNAIAAPSPRTIVDLGCGAGNVTALLAAHWPEARIVGVDSSPEMLARARDSAPDGEWQRADIARWQAREPVDLLFSNAALHWLPDHERLFPRLLAQLAAGGVLAVQMPRQWDAPSHTLLAQTAAEPRWRERFCRVARAFSHPPTFYYELLAARAASLDIWETTYLHVLDGADAVAEWTRGTVLVPFLEALEGAERGEFEAEYRRRLAMAYPRGEDGRTLFAFRRLFLVARR